MSQAKHTGDASTYRQAGRAPEVGLSDLGHSAVRGLEVEAKDDVAGGAVGELFGVALVLSFGPREHARLVRPPVDAARPRAGGIKVDGDAVLQRQPRDLVYDLALPAHQVDLSLTALLTATPEIACRDDLNEMLAAV